MDYKGSFPIYSPMSRCVKCGHAIVSTRYCAVKNLSDVKAVSNIGTGLKFPNSSSWCDLTPIEHMHRICDRCNYSWAEKAVDADLTEKYLPNPAGSTTSA